MLSLKSNISYRFMRSDSVVHVIHKCVCQREQELHRRTFYTQPFYNKDKKEDTNVLIAFKDPHICQSEANTLKTIHGMDCVHCTPLQLKELQGISYMMKLPVVVVIDAYCFLNDKEHVIEAYYYYLDKTPNLKDIFQDL